jgi:leucyl aminopeptidase (aminopeptidase T)
LRADYAASRRNAAACREFVLRLRRVLGWALVDAGIRIAAGRVETPEGRFTPRIDADENAKALRSLTEIDEGARRHGGFSLVDDEGRIGPLDTVFYRTLPDENVSSHIALGNGLPFLIETRTASAPTRAPSRSTS